MGYTYGEIVWAICSHNRSFVYFIDGNIYFPIQYNGPTGFRSNR